MKSALLLVVFVMFSSSAFATEIFHGVEMRSAPPAIGEEGSELMDDGWQIGTKVGTVLSVRENCGSAFVLADLYDVILEARDKYAKDWMFQQAYKQAWVSTEVNVRAGGKKACVDAMLKLEQAN